MTASRENAAGIGLREDMRDPSTELGVELETAP
jgi:hypothetical protein